MQRFTHFAQISTDFARISRDFDYIKVSGVRFHPLHPRLLHQCSGVRFLEREATGVFRKDKLK